MEWKMASIKVSYMTKDFNADQANSYPVQHVKSFTNMTDVFRFISRVKINPNLEGRIVYGKPIIQG